MNYSNSLKRATGACCLCACLCLSGSAAYMTYSTTVQNVITMGSVQIELDVEDGTGQSSGEGAGVSSAGNSVSGPVAAPLSRASVTEQTTVPLGCVPAIEQSAAPLGKASAPEQNAVPQKEVTVLPGTSVPYKVRVQNTGTDDAFIRIKLDCRATPEQFQDFVALDINYRAWTYQNGFLVYRDLVKPGQLTEPLFTTINFSPEYSGLPNAEAKLRASSKPSCTVSVAAYAVQAANNAPSSLLAFGWPEE